MSWSALILRSPVLDPFTHIITIAKRTDGSHQTVKDRPSMIAPFDIEIQSAHLDNRDNDLAINARERRRLFYLRDCAIALKKIPLQI
jgi:hypothetical protein